MLVLALDTSSAAVTAAVAEVDGTRARLLAHRVTVNARGHAELLAPSITECLRKAGAVPRDLTAVVAGLGPGPFTGLRVGLVTAAVLADTLGIPAYGVCSLDAIAPPSGADGDVLVVTDALRREVYWARYDSHGARLDGPHVARPDDVALDDIAAVCGAGVRRYPERFGALPVAGGEYPDAAELVRRALERVASSADGEVLTPLYLRRPDAVANPTVKPVSQ